MEKGGGKNIQSSGRTASHRSARMAVASSLGDPPVSASPVCVRLSLCTAAPSFYMGSHVAQVSLGFAAASQAFFILLCLSAGTAGIYSVASSQQALKASISVRDGATGKAVSPLPPRRSHELVREFRLAKQEQRNEVMSKAHCYEGNTKTQWDGTSWGRRGYFTWGGWQGLMGAECPLNVLLRGFKRKRTFLPGQKPGVLGRWAGFEEPRGLGAGAK